MRRIVIVLIGLLAIAAPARAHGDLVKISPEPGSTISTPPMAISITYSEDLILDGSQIAASDADGNAVALGPAQLDGKTLSAAWPADSLPGSYTVSYRIAGADGHVVTDEFNFTLGASATQTPIVITPGPSSTEEPTLIATPMPASTPSGVNHTILYFGLAATLLLGIALATWLIRRNG